MKLGKKKMVMLCFMLFSLFFGAGNLIFPPFLGQSAGESSLIAMSGFLITAVVLPVLGVIVVAEFDGLDKLASKVSVPFAVVFTTLIYMSIGPGLGIPRAASVPFEMAVAPYLPEGANLSLYMALYSLVFFIVATWLALTPSKLVERIGKILSPTLVTLIIILFVSFLFNAPKAVGPALNDYADNALVKGFLEGYQTMDTIAALNFGLVIATTLATLGIKDKKDMMKYTVKAGIVAGLILSSIYLMLMFIGMQSSGLYDLPENGAWTLRMVVYELFGNGGAIFIATIFTLACLTTCVGLITSISQYFTKLFDKLNYRTCVFVIATFSLVICNQGLTTILSLSIPVLDAIYPVSIVLIVLGLSHKYIANIKNVYAITIGSVACVSVVFALYNAKVAIPYVNDLFLKYLPLYNMGLGWVLVAIIAFVIAVILSFLNKKPENI